MGKKRLVGRPLGKLPIPPYNLEPIIAWLAAGKTLRSYCRQDGAPSYSAVYDWMDKDDNFAQRIARARDSGVDSIADECVELSDIEPADQVQAAWRRTQIDTRLKLLAKWSPKKYGDRTAVEHQGGISLTVVTGVPRPDDSITGRKPDAKQIT